MEGQIFKDLNIVEGKKELLDYFGVSWNTIKKELHSINNTNIVWKDIAGRWHLNKSAYEKKYGDPQRRPPASVTG